MPLEVPFHPHWQWKWSKLAEVFFRHSRHLNTQSLLQKQGTVKTEMDVGCHSAHVALTATAEVWHTTESTDTRVSWTEEGSPQKKHRSIKARVTVTSPRRALHSKSQNDGQISIECVLVIHGPHRLNLRVLLTSWLLSRGQNIHFCRRYIKIKRADIQKSKKEH